MGLDMYLYAKRVVTDDETVHAIKALLPAADDTDGESYLSMWPHAPEKQRNASHRIMDLAGLTPLIGEESSSGSAMTTDSGMDIGVTVAYWRKANAIHGWFVDNVQGGVDECQESDVHPEQLAHLLRTCEQAISAFKDGGNPEAILPPRSGFFFGSDEVDEWYLQDLESTVSELRRVIQTAARLGGGIRFTYQASW